MNPHAPGAGPGGRGLVIVALGANVGDPAASIRLGFERLQALASSPLKRSSLWLTNPVDCPAGSPQFVNAVAGFIPLAGETPESLLPKLQAIEQACGRRPKLIQNEPRPLDLDLIVFGDEVRSGKILTLPHPRAHLRRFVLAPLCEIAPALVLPGQADPVEALLARLASEEAVRRLEDP